MNPTPNALPVQAIPKQSGQPFPSYCRILYFPGSHLNSARRLLAGCAPGVAWPIDSAHQRWTEASIKKHGTSLLWWGSGLRYECVRMHAGLRWAIEPRFSIPLCGRQHPWMWMCFSLTRGNRCGMAATPLTKTNPQDFTPPTEYDTWYI